METPSGLQEVIDLAVQMLSRGQHFSMPGKVDVYNSSRQTVDVIPQFRDVVDSDDPDEPFEYFDLPIIPDVPIGWMSSLGGTLSITMPMQAKDPVTLIFTDFDHGQYREKGEPSEPADLRAHGLSGAWAYPGGIRPNKEILDSAAVDATHMVLGTKVKLGDATAAQHMVKGDDFKTVTYDPHLHPTPMGPSGVTTPMAASSLSTEHLLDK